MERWYAVCVRAQRERATGAILSDKGFESFVPLCSSRRKWADRQKVLSVPLFPGYVFCRMEAMSRLQVLVTPGVYQIVSDSRGPISVPDSEIDAIRRVASSRVVCTPWPFIEVGQRAEITSGSLEGLRGIVTRVKSDLRLVVSVSLLQRSVALEIDATLVRPVAERAISLAS
jgi:transcription antitermination factor NusG